MKKVIMMALGVLALVGCGKSAPETKSVGTTERDTINGVPCVVYMPYNSGESREKSREYPVLYLQHGMWGNEFDWTEKGNLVGIMDSLLLAGKVVEMVVIMPDNCPSYPTFEEEVLSVAEESAEYAPA